MPPETLPIQAGNWASLNAHLSALREPTATEFTIYVDHVNGNDTNDGKTLGSAVKTIGKALLLTRLAGQRAEIHFIEGGQIDVTAPLHISVGVFFRCLARGILVINRNFGTPSGRSVWDAVTTVGGSTVTSATASFTNADAGRIVAIYGAGFGSGTYYDFINGNPPNGTTANLTATTTKARSASTDPKGVKMSIVGDWSRVVTDASMSSGGSVVTSATAAWTQADINTELVIAGAGQGGQALRTVITAVSGNTATVLGVSSATISNARCAIGVVFGDLFVFHAGVGGMRQLNIQDQSSGQARIGAAIKIVADDQGSGSQPSPSDLIFEYPLITSTDTAGAWEHNIDIDGSWNQFSGGPGARRWTFVVPELFGTRRPTENVRIVSGVHGRFIGGNIEASAPLSPAIAQGIMILDPAKTGGASGYSSSDINFVGCEGFGCYFYCEGQFVNYDGGRLGPSVAASGRVAIEFGSTADHCHAITSNCASTNSGETDSGTNNLIFTQSSLNFGLNGGLNGLNSAVGFKLQGGTSGANVLLQALSTATLRIQTVNNADIDILTNSALHQRFAKTGSFIAQLAGALATSATDGFIYLPTCAGVPTGVPTAITGAAACVYDTTNNKLWVYNGAWKGVVLA